MSVGEKLSFGLAANRRPESALALFMARVFANDAQDSMPPNNAAVTAETLH